MDWKNRNAQYKKAWRASGLPPLGMPATTGLEIGGI
jgi:hypothetical protein